MFGRWVYSGWILADFAGLPDNGPFLDNYEKTVNILVCLKFIVGLCISCRYWSGGQLIPASDGYWLHYRAGKLGFDSL